MDLPTGKKKAQPPKGKKKLSMESESDMFKLIPIPDEMARSQLAEMMPAPKRRGKKTSKRLSEAAQLEYLRMVYSGEILIKKVDPDKLRGRIEAEAIAQEYSKQHAHYYDHRPTDWRRRLENKGILGCCSKAAVYAAMEKCSVEDYVNSQFWFFHTAYGRPPRYQDLAGPKAVERYKAYIEHVAGEKGKVASPVSVVVKGRVDTRKFTRTEVFQYEFETLKRMESRWGGEKEVWTMWGDPSETDVFSNAFKKTRPIWCNMYEKECTFTATFQIACDEPIGLVDGTEKIETFTKTCADPLIWARNYARSLQAKRAKLPSRAKNPKYVVTKVTVLDE